MDCIKKEFVRTDADGRKWWRVILASAESVGSIENLTGADVDGMDDNIRFAAGSVLLTPDGNSVLYTDGWQNTEVLYITLSAEGVLDKTWQEIKDAFDAGITCIVNAPTWDDPPIVDAPVADVSAEPDHYIVVIRVGEDLFYFGTDGPNGYPAFE